MSDVTPKPVTIFGREPATIIAAIAAVLAVVIGFMPDALTVNQSGAITAVLTALAGVWTAFKVRPIAPTIFTTLITTGATLLGTYGFDLTQSQVGVLSAASVALMTAIVVWPQSTPAADPRPTGVVPAASPTMTLTPTEVSLEALERTQRRQAQ
ncbi:hypothetical protein BDK92_7236 [Micromonospora pisi]|uniref:Holin n=1 Tax=Micromonospora pisi TaxID=589240 RepID=A0A495JUS1_9ACTN|nr:hypothetical protein [Micromonospora pisi]RKR92756.1 hypothetical protein BDK92_7236 [Micromonospora pisi]